jgi:NAD-dependent SIR2 family protein deacetylase
MNAETLFALLDFLDRHRRIVVLTGAGISVSAGIPSYRDHRGNWRKGRPIQHREFLQSLSARQRYWSRSMVGWPVIDAAEPTAAHRALSALEQLGRIELLITQNVDRLHQRAGSENAIDLHGRLDRVNCLDCAATFSRKSIQERLEAAHPHLLQADCPLRPDGDADLDDAGLAGFQVPACVRCGGRLMPDVVFFGGTIPAQRLEQCRTALQGADALLVVGSSLQVFSGFRFCRESTALKKPLAIINPGSTRADDLASLRLAAEADPLLAATVQLLSNAVTPALPTGHLT